MKLKARVYAANESPSRAAAEAHWHPLPVVELSNTGMYGNSQGDAQPEALSSPCVQLGDIWCAARLSRLTLVVQRLGAINLNSEPETESH